MDRSLGHTRVVLLGDVHPLFRAGMRYLLHDALAPVEVVEAGNRSDALALLERGHFDLVLTSLFSAEGPWDDFVADLIQRAPAGRLMILSSVDDPSLICRVLVAGAAGYVLKQTAPELTLHAIRLVLAGGVYIPPAALGLLGRGTTAETSARVPAEGIRLSERQQAVLNLLMKGASNKLIARALGLSAGTVKAHVASLLRLYGAENRTELVHAATKRGSTAKSRMTSG
jgi:DNA-binding NarL/FixJ family response regulator